VAAFLYHAAIRRVVVDTAARVGWCIDPRGLQRQTDPVGFSVASRASTTPPLGGGNIMEPHAVEGCPLGDKKP
jgi:hypothetical protein